MRFAGAVVCFASLLVALLGCGSKSGLTVPRAMRAGVVDAGEDASIVVDASRDAGVAADGGAVVPFDPTTVCPEGAIAFVVPRVGAPMPLHQTVRFDVPARPSTLMSADVYLLVDISYSMIGEVSALRRDLRSIIRQLAVLIPDLRTGLGVFIARDHGYENRASLAVGTGAASTLPEGLDFAFHTEPLFESTACVVDPTLCTARGCATSGIGCPGYRAGDVARILVAITDEPDECTTCVADSAEEAGRYLLDAGITFIGIDGASSGPRRPTGDLSDIGRAAGSLSPDGEPFVFDGDRTDVLDAILSGVNAVAGSSPSWLGVSLVDDTSDSVDVATLVERLEVARDDEDCARSQPLDRDADGIDEAYRHPIPDRDHCFRVVARDAPAAARIPGVYAARVRAHADDEPVGERALCFVVL